MTLRAMPTGAIVFVRDCVRVANRAQANTD